MERPAVIYLEQPIVINGMPVRYSREGARYLKEHWEQVMQIMPDNKCDKAHIKIMLENYNQTLELYASQTETNTIPN
jgi:hypothetical protein